MMIIKGKKNDRKHRVINRNPQTKKGEKGGAEGGWRREAMIQVQWRGSTRYHDDDPVKKKPAR